MNYPVGWPNCPACGKPALRGHMTCGRAFCNKSEEQKKADAARLAQTDPAAAFKAQLLSIARDIEARFPGANITLIISDPEDSKYSHVTTAKPEHLQEILRKLHVEYVAR